MNLHEIEDLVDNVESGCTVEPMIYHKNNSESHRCCHSDMKAKEHHDAISQKMKKKG